jgi:hypothetical protein
MKRFNISVVAAALCLTACSGGGGNFAPQTNAPAAAISGDTSPSLKTRQATANVAFVIDWPKPKSNARRHSRFVSPSTMSVVLQTGSGKNTVTAIANNHGQTTTRLELTAPVGRDTFTVSLYDAFQKENQPIAGQELGQGEVTQQVVAGKVTPLHVVIDGAVAKIGVALAENTIMTTVSGTLGQQTLTFVGDVPAMVTLEPLDADGNVIVAPGAVPSVDLTVGVDSIGGISVAPVKGKANTFEVTPQGPSTNGTFGLIATAKDGQGGSATMTIPVVESQAIYVSYANGAGSRIAVYDKSGRAMPLATTAFAGVTQPVGLSYDSDDHLVFVADASGKLLAFDGEGNPSKAFKTLSVPGITAVNYFNASAQAFPELTIPNQKRVIAAGSNGIAEFDETSGALLADTPLLFNPTAVSGFVDPPGSSALSSPSGWLVMVGDPGGSVDAYDLVTPTLSPLTTLTVAAGAPAGFGALLMQGTFGFAGDYCMSGKSFYDSRALQTACLYAVTGATSTIVRLGDSDEGTPFGESGLPGSYKQIKKPGSLSGVAVDQLNYELAVTQANTNSIAEFGVIDNYNPSGTSGTFQLPKKLSFTTPASLGFSKPNSIAVEW